MIRAVACIAAMLFSSAALADQTVVYKGADGKNLTIEIADGGAVHIVGPVPGQTALVQDGALFLIDTAAETPRVMRLADVAAAIDETIGPMFRGLFDAANAGAAPAQPLAIEAAGTATVAGFAGNAYRIRGIDKMNPDAMTDWVATRDPALASAGEAMQQFMEATMVMAAPLIGDVAAGMIADMRQAFALGTLLKAGTKFELASVKDGAIDPARFRLPAAPMSRADLLKEMKAGTPPS
jgi:hypothetical protein